MGFALTLAFIFTGLANAQPRIIRQQSADTPMYSVVIQDGRKLRMPIQQALALIPGLECSAIADTNSILNCPGLAISGGFSYNLLEGFPKFMILEPSNDPRKPPRERELRVDGLNVKNFSNFMVPGQCVISGVQIICPPVPPPQQVNVRFTRPTTEFGFTFRPNSPSSLDQVFISGFEITANGVYLGFVPVAPDGVQYIGITAPEGLINATFKPIDILGFNGPESRIGPFYGDKFFYK